MVDLFAFSFFLLLTLASGCSLHHDIRRQQLATNESSLQALIRAHLPMEYVEKLIPYARANNQLYPPLKKAKVCGVDARLSCEGFKHIGRGLTHLLHKLSDGINHFNPLYSAAGAKVEQKMIQTKTMTMWQPQQPQEPAAQEEGQRRTMTTMTVTTMMMTLTMTTWRRTTMSSEWIESPVFEAFKLRCLLPDCID